MKILYFAIVLTGVLYACNPEDVEKPFVAVCSDVQLETVNWMVCDSVRLFPCGDERDIYLTPTRQIVVNATGSVIQEKGGTKPFCIVSDTGGYWSPFNLPECYKVDGLKVRFSGVEKQARADFACGFPFEITMIEEIP